MPLYEAVVPAPPGIVVDGLDEVVADPALVVLALDVELVVTLVVVDGPAVVVVLEVVAAVELLAAEPGRHCEYYSVRNQPSKNRKKKVASCQYGEEWATNIIIAFGTHRPRHTAGRSRPADPAALCADRRH